MEESEKIWIATWAFANDYDTDEIRWCDYLYGKEEFFDDVLEYLEELSEIGRIAFYEKYSQFKLY